MLSCFLLIIWGILVRFLLLLIVLVFPCLVTADLVPPHEPFEDRLKQLTRTIMNGQFTPPSSMDLAESELEDLAYYPIASKYVNTDLLNVRNKPINGLVIGELKRGDNILIYDRNGIWDRISEHNQSQQWVSSQSLCSGVNCYLNNKTSVVHLNSNKYNNKSDAISKSTTSPRKYSSDVSCPCSGVNNCIGPRGGRYCYTSGGNKRYR